MSDDMSERLSRIRESATLLNELCDQGAESVRALEEFLANECSVGVECQVNVWREEEFNEYGSAYRCDYCELCYGRFGTKFRVFLKWTSSDDRGDGNTKAWAECTRADKLKSLPLLADLVEAIERTLQDRVEKAQLAVSLVQHLTSASGMKGVTSAQK